jgi:hypothetical protein
VYSTRRFGDFQEFAATKGFFVASTQQNSLSNRFFCWKTRSQNNFYQFNQGLLMVFEEFLSKAPPEPDASTVIVLSQARP